MEGNICTDGWFGISYTDQAGGIARQNDCSKNNVGITVIEYAQPTLERNICNDNETYGITYHDNAGGVARQNECARNEKGILVWNADPYLVDNNCYDNSVQDIEINP